MPDLMLLNELTNEVDKGLPSAHPRVKISAQHARKIFPHKTLTWSFEHMSDTSKSFLQLIALSLVGLHIDLFCRDTNLHQFIHPQATVAWIDIPMEDIPGVFAPVKIKSPASPGWSTLVQDCKKNEQKKSVLPNVLVVCCWFVFITAKCVGMLLVYL